MHNTNGEFESLIGTLQASLADEDDLIANISTCTAVLFEGMEAVDWVGVYFVRGNEMVLGPFQGRAARSRMSLQHPVAGRAVCEARSTISNDLTGINTYEEGELPARSRIVVPFFMQDRVVAVFQVDSPFVNRFEDNDRLILERAAQIVLQQSNTSSLLLKRSVAPPRSKVKAEEKHDIGTQRQRAPEHPPAARATKEPAWLSATRHPKTQVRFHQLKQAAAILVILLFFFTALSNSVYEATSPSSFQWHILQRKLYSVIAFSITGALVSMGWRFGMVRTTLLLAGYSAAIEIAQAFAGSHEGLGYNTLDVLCGALGGYIGAVSLRGVRRWYGR